MITPASPPTTTPKTLDLQRALRVRWWVVVLCVVLAAGAAVFSASRQTKQYAASASLYFRDLALDQRLFPTAFAQSNDAMREASTNLRLTEVNGVARRVARDKRFGLTAKQVGKRINLSAEGNSDLISVTATDTDPVRAANLASAYAHAFVAFRRDSDRKTILEPARLLRSRLARLTPEERTSSENRSLAERVSELETLADVQTGNASVVEDATVDRSAVSPRPKRDGFLAGVVGLLLGLVIVVVAQRVDRRVRSAEEVEEQLGAPTLVEIPTMRREGQPFSPLTAGGRPTDTAALERFNILRTTLRYFDPDRLSNELILVTSATAGEGKSTVSANLAYAAALDGSHPLLIQADMRRGARSAIGAEGRAGLGPYLAGLASLEDSIASYDLPATAAGHDGVTLDVLPPGPGSPNALQLLQSQRMRDLLAMAQEQYDFVVIDTPPVNDMADALSLVDRVSGVVVVARFGQTTGPGLATLRERLGGVSAPLLGSVLNAVPRGLVSSAYYEEETGPSERLAALLKR